MGKIFDKLFLKNVEKIKSEIEIALDLLEISQRKINEIKSDNKVNLLLCELKNLIKEFAQEHHMKGFNLGARIGGDSTEKIEKLSQEIQQIFDEITELQVIQNCHLQNEASNADQNAKIHDII